jgi:hypothetical protein
MQSGDSISFKMGSNSLKIRVLRTLDGRGWLSAPMISALTGFRPVRAVYTYMDRLRRWGLVERRKPLGGPIMWSISQRGRERLAWLNRAEI